MNKEEAIYKFIKERLSFLTSNDFDKKILKTYIKQYFVITHNKKFGIPNISEICTGLINYQIKYKVGRDKLISEINNFPVYAYISNNKKIELTSLVENNYESGLTESEVERLQKMSSIEAAKELQKDEIEKQLKEENEGLKRERITLEKEIADKKEESLLLNSVLDSDVILEPDFNPEVEYVKQWWERFYLKKDPFPGNKDGLARVDEALYEHVVSKSPPYNNILNKLNKDEDYLFHTSHLLVGDFGFGKTTFQDYLIYYLAKTNILPIRITCLRAYPDSNGYHDHFMIGLKNKLLRNCETLSKEDVNILPAEDAVIELAGAISKTMKGIVIFLDDYHKFIKNYDAVYDFLGSLQPIKDELTRNNCNVGFIVSGVPKWEKQLANNQQLSGFFDSPLIRMPKASVEFIQDMFNRRIRAYCYDSEPRTISNAFIEKIYKKTNGQSSYRDYLNLIVEELENNNFSIVNTPIEINDSILSQIKSLLLKDHIISSSINKLLKESNFKKFNQEQIDKCLELIVVIYGQDSVDEGDRIFTDNMFYFNRLNDCGLIQKKKLKTGVKGFSWVVSKRLIDIGEKINEKFNYSIPDYFLKIFAHTVDDIRSAIVKQDDTGSVSRFKRYLSNDISKRLDNSVVDNIADAMAQFDRFETDPSDQRRATAAVTSIRRSFESLSNALFVMDGTSSYFKNSNIHDLREKWDMHPVGDDTLNDMLDKVESYEKERDSISYSIALTTATGAFEYLIDYLEDTIKDNIGNDINAFKYRQNIEMHNEKDIKIFETIKTDMFTSISDRHFNYIAQITNHLENVFRSFLYACSTSCFGISDYVKYIQDNGAVSYAHKNINKSENSYINLFEGFTRPQYRQVFIQGGLIKELIIKEMDLTWTHETWDLFFEIFIQENISTSHQKISEYSTRNIDRYITYCNLSQKLIGAMNRLVSKIVNRHLYLNYDSMNIQNCLFKIGFASKDNNIKNQINLNLGDVLKKNDKLHEHHVNPSIFEKIKNNIMGKLELKHYYIEDLLNIEYIHNHYGYSYHDFILSLGFLVFVEKKVEVKTWLGSRVIISKIQR